MEIIPVIEVRSGKSTRSTFVRSDQPNILRDDVLLIAKRWKDEGATRIHIHDVDGARVGMPHNRDQLRDVVRRIGLPVQYSGGVRTPEVVERVLGWGVDRVIADPETTLNLACKPTIQKLGQAVALELRPFNGKIPRPGGPPGAWLDVLNFLRETGAIHCWPRIVCRVSLGDGGIAPPGSEDIAKFIQQARVPVNVFAKFRNWDELRLVHKTGPEAIIVHEALYDGALSLPDLINWAKNAGKEVEKSSDLKPWMPGYKPGAPGAPGAAAPGAPPAPRANVPAPPSRPTSARPQNTPHPPLPPKR